ncbi:hypothetical protein HC031_25300 [Planosporangium thailandense]|uniref:Uncharacterized protein n=1 Tax=Planosporangium thailandense TaxID=765197 RepID=A0ABX0Y4Q0_9ACTN|nr:hypothetical protein [Planosporangium thailandense]NJC73008.1 hypothetical protein [Planosporangium thailandense]
MVRRIGALLAVALPPWAIACLLAVVASPLFGDGTAAARQMFRDLFLTPNALIPIVVFVACLAVIAIVERGRFFSASQHWAVGGLLALAATTAVAILGLVWGGAYVCYWLLFWSVCSGYWALVWLAGAYAWRSLAVARLEKSPVQAYGNSR